MPPVPLLSGDEIVRVGTLGWSVARTHGSHVILVREGSIATLSVPRHREVARGTLRSLIGAADVTTADFLAAAGRR